MNIVIRYLGIGIEGIPLKQFKTVLNGQDSITIKSTGKGMLLLSNKKMIKCIKEYYAVRNASSTSKIKASNQCYYTQKEFNITGVSNYSCTDCHKQCLSKQENGDLVLK